MTRRKIQIKKIDSITARQVTFSKRRKGLFKKAQELATLCDADIALLVFSSTGKLFEYASSSMEQVIEKYDQYAAIQRIDQSSAELQLEGDPIAYDKMQEIVAEKTHELRKLTGEDLQGYTLKDLQTLEEKLERGLSRVLKTKDERLMKHISTLKRKGAQLMEENRKMKQVQSLPKEQKQSSDQSITICISSDHPPQDCDSSDTSLRLGLPLFK